MRGYAAGVEQLSGGARFLQVLRQTRGARFGANLIHVEPLFAPPADLLELRLLPETNSVATLAQPHGGYLFFRRGISLNEHPSLDAIGFWGAQGPFKMLPLSPTSTTLFAPKPHRALMY